MYMFRLKNTLELFATVYLSGVTTQIWICFVLFVEQTELIVFIMRFCVFQFSVYESGPELNLSKPSWLKAFLKF